MPNSIRPTKLAVVNAMIGFIRVAPKKALAAHTKQEDLRDRLELLLPPESPEVLAYRYAATYTEEEPIR